MVNNFNKNGDFAKLLWDVLGNNVLSCTPNKDRKNIGKFPYNHGFCLSCQVYGSEPLKCIQLCYNIELGHPEL